MKEVQVVFEVSDETDVDEFKKALGQVYVGDGGDEHVQYVLDHVTFVRTGEV